MRAFRAILPRLSTHLTGPPQVSKHDSHFFNVFSVVLGLLVAFALGVFAFAHYIGKHEQVAHVLTDPMTQQSTEQRVASPARVAVAGQDNSALAIAPVAATAAGSAAPVELKNGTDVFENVCKACHGQGLAGAPKIGDKAAWAPRLAQGKATLYEHVLKGFTGKTGVMPPKGGRTDLSDDLIKQAVDHVVALNK
jgi:cytochrome c5